MRTVEEHQRDALALVTPTEPVLAPLDAALGLVTCADLVARVDLPGFDNSAMDGYAVRAADVAGAEEGSPVALAVVGEVPAGRPALVPVGPGEAVRIMTGAMMPPGADTVVKVEDTTADGPDRVLVVAAAGVGTSVRSRAEDVSAGSTILPAGSRLDARRIALLAATGHGEVLVHRRPVVAVLSTGSELVPAGQDPQPGQIHDSNSHMLRAVVIECGAEAVRCEPVEDSGPALRAVLAELSGRVDAVITSGGVSMGDYDVVKEAFGVVGASGSGAVGEVGTISFVQVAMQPGKPQGLGRLGPRGVPLFALPGNPVSAYVSFEVFVRPALLAMMGVTDVAPAVERGRVTAPMRSPRGRRQIARAVASRGADGLVADPVWGQASHFVADLSRANAFVLIPEDVTSVAADDEVDIVLLSGAPRGVDPKSGAAAPPASSTSGQGGSLHG